MFSFNYRSIAGNDLLSSDLIFSISVDCISFRDSVIPNLIKVRLPVKTVDQCCSQPLTACIQRVIYMPIYTCIRPILTHHPYRQSAACSIRLQYSRKTGRQLIHATFQPHCRVTYLQSVQTPVPNILQFMCITRCLCCTVLYCGQLSSSVLVSITQLLYYASGQYWDG